MQEILDSLLLVLLLLVLFSLLQLSLFGETFLSFDLTQELVLLLGGDLIKRGENRKSQPRSYDH